MLLTLLVSWLLLCPALAEQPAPAGAEAYGHTARDGGLDCVRDPCSSVMPAADSFEAVEGKPYLEGLSGDDLVGWVVLSTDLVDIKGYSGQPLSTLIGLNTEGVITGARVLHHSEPILLIGIPEQRLHDFVDLHAGMRGDERVVVGQSSDPDARTVDIVSGATVTALAESRTIMDSVTALGQDVGAIERRVQTPGHFVATEELLSWQQLLDEGVFGRLTVTAKDMGATGDEYLNVSGDQLFMDIWFTVADSPRVGRSLLGPNRYAHAMSQLAPGEHLVVVLGQGASTFKGSGFVRGGLFDRIRLTQGLAVVMFHDLDYTNLGGLDAEGAPEFKEGALFVARGGALDPGRSFELVFLGSRFDNKGGFSRDFHSFTSTHRLPKSVYVLDGPDPERALWLQAWRNKRVEVLVVGLWLLSLVAVFAGRRWTTADGARLKKLHTGYLIFAFVVGGLMLSAQPSVTQILTFVDSLVGGWRWGLFLSEPLLFLSWIFIAVVTLIWGRGVFCGWACPYGALNELTFKLGRLLKLPEYELPEVLHSKLRYLRYAILAGLIGVYLWDPMLGERAAEIEPFKSTFFVAIWTREWFFIAWWVALASLSLVMYRPFCRYVCPLGAGLAIPGSFRLSGPYRRDFCSKCKICTKTCEPRAIRPDGSIDPRECLSCMECEANWRDDQVCPPLVKARRDRERAAK